MTGGISIGMPNFLPRPAYPHEQRYQFLDNVTYFHGAHTLKVGTDINFIKEELINLFQGGGVYSFTSLNNIATDCPQGAAGCTPVPSGALTGKHYNTYTQAFDVNNLGGARELQRVDLQLLRPGHLARHRPAAGQPGSALRISAAATARERGHQRRDLCRQPGRARDDEHSTRTRRTGRRASA